MQGTRFPLGVDGSVCVPRYSITKGLHRVLRRLFVLPAALALSLLALLIPSTGFAQSALQPGQAAVVIGTEGRGLKVRGGPAMTHRVVTTVAEGAAVQIIAGPVSDGSDDWYQVGAGGATTGWAVGQYLSPGTAVRTMSLNENGSRVFLGKVTAYADGIGGVAMGARTYSGTDTRWGVVAVDPKVIPIGSALMIEGYDGIFIAEDIGGGIRGEAIDIWLPDANEARRYGTQYRKITILREGPAR
jgi:3D (Asp-Asp-Asp) domain-containing protein